MLLLLLQLLARLVMLLLLRLPCALLLLQLGSRGSRCIALPLGATARRRCGPSCSRGASAQARRLPRPLLLLLLLVLW
jgi:hypothetical protein